MLVQGHKHGTFVCGFDRFRPRPSRATNVAPGVGHSTEFILHHNRATGVAPGGVPDERKDYPTASLNLT